MVNVTVQVKHGDAGKVAAYTGPSGEIVINDDSKVPHLQDGTTPGGHNLEGVTHAVSTPSVTSPLNASTGVPIMPTFASSAFSGNGNHSASYWEVASDSNFSTIVHSSGRDTVNLISYQLPVTLSELTQYYVRVRHESSLAVTSSWSTGVSFTTKNAIPTQQVDVLTPSLTPSGDKFGCAVAISANGSTVAVGARLGEYVEVFTLNNGDWIYLERLTAPVPLSGDGFGSSVSISNDGSVIAVASPTRVYGAGQGVVNTFHLTNGSYSTVNLIDKLSYDGADVYGGSIALSGDGLVLAVGSEGHGNKVGIVEVFRFSGGSWSRVAFLSDAAPADSKKFGYATAISYDGSVIAVSNHYGFSNTDRSKVFIFGEYTPDNWQLDHTIDPGDATVKTASARSFGDKLALSDDGLILAVSAHYELIPSTTTYSGGVYLFEDVSGKWTSRGLLTPSDGVSVDFFSASLALNADGGLLVVGARYVTVNGTNNAGAVYYFTRDGNAWTQLSRLTASTPVAEEHVGVAVDVAANANTTAVGVNDTNKAYLFN